MLGMGQLHITHGSITCQILPRILGTSNTKTPPVPGGWVLHRQKKKSLHRDNMSLHQRKCPCISSNASVQALPQPAPVVRTSPASFSHLHLVKIFSKIRLPRYNQGRAADFRSGGSRVRPLVLAEEGRLVKAGGLPGVCPTLILPLQGTCHCCHGQTGKLILCHHRAMLLLPTGPHACYRWAKRGVRGFSDITWNQE